ncbi:MAG: hypothetical protein A2V66_18445 [Ignavibacteria bacterium RBG_13_36_8]|nr:MAG: hypothetical protein A2V66_18445 [Ignavibacteria bacterium RBG_13_36_8]
MEKKYSPFITVLPNITAGVLFLVGGIRFYYRADTVGAIIFILASLIFFLLAFVNIGKLRAHKN